MLAQGGQGHLRLPVRHVVGPAARLGESWVWLKTDRWLKQQLDPKHFEYLQPERKSLQEQLQAAMVKLAAEKAWFTACRG